MHILKYVGVYRTFARGYQLDHLTVKEMTRAFMLITSWFNTKAALQRMESKGGHFHANFPCENITCG